MKYLKWLSLIPISFTLLFVSCNSDYSGLESNTKLSSSETVFEVSLPEKLESEAVIYLEILDEVTGVSLNPKRYEMQQKDDYSLYARIPLSDGSMIRYRYIKHTNADQIEFNSTGEQVYYRTYIVDHPAVVNDKVAGWLNEKPIMDSGEISGFVYDAKTNLPIPGMYISINGSTGISFSDGFYQIQDVLIGEYYLVAYHPDDLYEPFQQRAIIAENSVTPASFGLNKAKKVEITFNLEVPDNTVEGAPVRFLGDSYSLGNIFAESNLGSSNIASRAPHMNYLGKRKYSITLELLAGSDLRYKYSLGDGFFNAEHSDEGSFFTRQLIVPGKDMTINNQVASWSSGSTEPITFQVTVPNNTPEGEYISIQFNPFMWMQPIQMWKTGENKWIYSLYSPLEYLDNSQFRFCRNDLCGMADDNLTSGFNGNGYLLEIKGSDIPRNIAYEINNWKYLDDTDYQKETISEKINKTPFIKGIQITNLYDPAWLPYLDRGFIDIAVNGANWVVLSPTRRLESAEQPYIKFNARNNISFNDLLVMNSYAQEAGLKQILFPQLATGSSSITEFWNTSTLSYNWWIEWFSQYERFILDYADFAEANNFTVLILGGNSVSPAFPSGRLPNGQLSNTPYDFPEKWKALINKVRSEFSGQLIFAIPSNLTENIDYAFLSDVDSFLIETNSSLTSSLSPSINELNDRFANELDNFIYKIVEKYQKPIIIGIDYSSIDGSASNCLNFDTPCSELLTEKSTQDISIDLAEQADIYTAIINTIIDRDWIIGVISQGYFPAAVVRDYSSSTRGKPAMDVLSNYFNEVIR